MREVDTEERWMALCQARKDTDGDGKIEIHVGHHGDLHGDSMEQYLVLGGGPGTLIDALPSHSSDGRWLAVVRGTAVELVDAQTGDVFPLVGADATSDGRPGSPHRAATFAKNRLLFIRHVDGSDDRLVVHDPATHREREITVPGRVWRTNGARDRLVRVFTIPNGAPFPKLNTSLASGECLGDVMSYSTYGMTGPAPAPHWIDLDTGAEVAGDGGAVAVGDTLVRTPADGALYFGAAQVAPPSCRIQLLAVMPSPLRAIAICGEHGKAKVALFGQGLRQDLASIDRDADHYGGLEDAIDAASGVVCGSGLHCVATATNKYIDLEGGVAEYAWGDKLYVVHATTASRRHEVIDVVSGVRTPLKTADVRMAAGKLIVDSESNVVDLETHRVIGKAGKGLRLSRKGNVLHTVGTGNLEGPVRWVSP